MTKKVLIDSINYARKYVEITEEQCNIIVEGFRFVYLAFRFRLAHGLIRCNINAGVHARAERMCHSEMSK